MIKKIFPTTPVILQLLRFGICGTLAAITHFLGVVLVVETLQISPLNANVIGFLAGFVVSFYGHHHWTFANNGRKWHAVLPLFLTLAGINFILNQTIFFILFRFFSLPYQVALIIAIGVVAIITFIISKCWIFKCR